MNSELFLRDVTIEDKQSVINIIQAFGGRDYMESYYDEMLADPNFLGVVAELGKPSGDMVAFVGAYIVDNGQTMSTKGSRVREDLHGKGVYKQLWKFLVDKVKERCPTLKYEEFTINTMNPLLDVPSSQRKYFELYRQPLKFFTATEDWQDKQELSDESITAKVVEVTPKMLRETLANEKLSNSLFPIRLVIDWTVYRPIVENVDIMEHHWKYVTGSLSSGSRTNLELIIFGAWFESSGHLAYTVDVYGKTDRLAVMVELVRRHVRKAFKLFSGKKYFPNICPAWQYRNGE